jgi:septal ring factor EnvC (AmiA/AmiB activator)
MKKLLMAMFVLSIVSFSCTDKKKENALNEEQKEEVMKLDSETEEIENVKKDIEESSKELDELLEDIE